MAYDFSESDVTRLVRQTTRRFAENEIAPRARDLDEREEFSVELTRKMGDLGLLGCIVSPEYGGQGLDYTSYIVAVEELARVDSSQAATVAAHTSLGAAPIFYYGNDDQKKRFLPSLCNGKGLWGFALTEPTAGSDAQASRTTATFDESRREWVINGQKLWVTNGASDITHGVTVQAVTGQLADGRREHTCFLVPSETPGVTRHPVKGKMMWRASNTAEIFLENVRVPESLMLGTRGQGFKIMMGTLDGGRLSIAAMGLGLAKGVLALTTRYAKERSTFGKPIIEHQAIAFKVAEMATRIEAAEGLLYKACWARQNKQPFAKLAAMSKLWCAEVAEFCAREGQQTFGGYGLMKEFPIERHYRDAALLRIGEGTDEILRLVISRYIGGRI